MPFGDEVYVVSRANELYKIDAVDGTYPDGWQMPLRGIKMVAGFGEDTIYCIDTSNRLIGIDRNTRAITKSVDGSSVELVMPNGITDRMFFATRSGFIQCVHEVGSLRPRFLETDLAIAKSKEEPGRKEDGENPFGDDAGSMDEENPFGDDSTPMEDDENPFGDDDSNPFGDDGGGDDSDDSDDDNPFG